MEEVQLVGPVGMEEKASKRAQEERERSPVWTEVEVEGTILEQALKPLLGLEIHREGY